MSLPQDKEGEYPIASLYVGNLDPEVTEATLLEKFSQVGPLLSILMCRDMSTNRSLGHAYVNFQHLQDAKFALDTMNYEPFNGRHCRIMWSPHDTSIVTLAKADGYPISSHYVGDLHPDVTEATLFNERPCRIVCYHQDPSLMTVPQVKRGNYHILSVYAQGLKPDVTEETLFEKFSHVAPVFSVIMCRDMVTNRSLGHAYVNFQYPEDAERALDTNCEPVNGRPCRIMRSQRDPSLHRTGAQAPWDPYSGEGKVFIKKLHHSIDSKALYDTFSAFGNIISCKVPTEGDNSTSKGFGLVQFDNQESADVAIQKANGTLLNGKKVFVSNYIPKSNPDLGPGQSFTKVFVKNFGEDFDSDNLVTTFEKFGKIARASIMRDDTGKSRGFGFVKFERHDGARKAIEVLNGSVVNGRPIYCARARKKKWKQMELVRQREAEMINRYFIYQRVNLYIKNLEDDLDDDKLRKEFARFGKITSAKVITDDNGRSKGYGFVCFSTPEEAMKAVTEMNGHVIVSKPLYVALAQRKQERVAHLTARRMQQMARGMPQSQLQTSHHSCVNVSEQEC